MARADVEPGTLYAIIAAVSGSADLGRVLAGIVDLLTEATACHACFVYLREGDRLRLRAASPVFAHLVGRIELGVDEGLAGWVAGNVRPAFIRENALADPRMKYVPELEEERFQSMVAVPVPSRAGDAIGVVVLHTQAPREFDRSVLTFLVGVASLVGGAIENARLLEEARGRVEALTRLAALNVALAAANGSEELERVVRERVPELLGAERCELLPPDAPTGPLAVPLAVGDERLGVLAVHHAQAPRPEGAELLRTVAASVALALQKAELIERLAAETRVRDLLDALEAGDAEGARARAARLGVDLAAPHTVVWGGPGSEAAEAALRALHPAALVDLGRQGLRALLPGAPPSDLDELARASSVALGVTGPRPLVPGALREAADAAAVARALRPAGGALHADELGAYRYLVRLPAGEATRDRHADAVARLAAHDARRRSDLVTTLERHLHHRGNVTATARELFIHPNTLRQRLERIERIAGLDLDREDLLALELAIKLVRLRGARDGS